MFYPRPCVDQSCTLSDCHASYPHTPGQWVICCESCGVAPILHVCSSPAEIAVSRRCSTPGRRGQARCPHPPSQTARAASPTQSPQKAQVTPTTIQNGNRERSHWQEQSWLLECSAQVDAKLAPNARQVSRKTCLLPFTCE